MTQDELAKKYPKPFTKEEIDYFFEKRRIQLWDLTRHTHQWETLPAATLAWYASVCLHEALKAEAQTAESEVGDSGVSAREAYEDLQKGTTLIVKALGVLGELNDHYTEKQDEGSS